MTQERGTKTENRVKGWLAEITEALGGEVNKHSPSVEIKMPSCIMIITFFGEEPTVYLLDRDTRAVKGREQFGLHHPQEVTIDPKEGVVVFTGEFDGFTHTLRVERTGLVTQTIEPPRSLLKIPKIIYRGKQSGLKNQPSVLNP